MTDSAGTVQLFANPNLDKTHVYSAFDLGVVGANAPEKVKAYLDHCFDYAPTPILALPGFAEKIGLSQVYLKDESQRFAIGSFKALGGIYAVMEVLRQQAEAKFGAPIDPSRILDKNVLTIAKATTFVCASDGNHGRSVAAGAALVGAKCTVFLHDNVSPARAHAISTLGATVQRVIGTYEDCVEAAERAAVRNGWTLVQDTSEDPESPIPALIMQGYTTIISEALEQLGDTGELPPFTHLFVQAGVGGLAAALIGYLHARYGRHAPTSIVVEPALAPCLLESCRAGKRTEVPYRGATAFSMLECMVPSALAWRILENSADFFMSVSDEFAAEAMRTLAFPQKGDPPVVTGESGSAGIAGLLAGIGDKALRDQIGLSANSRVLIISTEGATDPDLYEEMVGRSAAEIRSHG